MNKIQNCSIHYKLKLTQGEHEGKIISLSFDIDELEEDDISSKLIPKYYESMGWPTDYYEVVERIFIVKDYSAYEDISVHNGLVNGYLEVVVAERTNGRKSILAVMQSDLTVKQKSIILSQEFSMSESAVYDMFN